jgi:methylthioribose-1-phosphate isomerase
MNVNGKHYRTIWIEGETVKIIDQRILPHEFIIEKIKTAEEMFSAIKEMHVRGAGLIGAAASYGIFLAAKNADKNRFDSEIETAATKLKSARPTAVNLANAIEKSLIEINKKRTVEEKIIAAKDIAIAIADEDADFCKKIGEHGLRIIEEISKRKKGETVNILTHCNAGWLAFVDYGSATSPIYAAFDKGIKVHVWVDETRPWNQGSRLTAWELLEHGVPHTIIADNTGGHLMQKGFVDMVIVGADRVARNGDTANKIGTYLKALAAKDNNIPFYVALPSTTFDFTLRDGKNIPIEERDPKEVKYAKGFSLGKACEVLLSPEKSSAANYGFDVTPARLITGIITERGITRADEKEILKMFKDI